MLRTRMARSSRLSDEVELEGCETRRRGIVSLNDSVMTMMSCACCPRYLYQLCGEIERRRDLFLLTCTCSSSSAPRGLSPSSPSRPRTSSPPSPQHLRTFSGISDAFTAAPSTCSWLSIRTHFTRTGARTHREDLLYLLLVQSCGVPVLLLL